MIVTFSQLEKEAKPFRLYNSWLENQTFMDLARSLLSKNIRGTELFKLQQKLKEVESLLRLGQQKMATQLSWLRKST